MSQLEPFDVLRMCLPKFACREGRAVAGLFRGDDWLRTGVPTCIPAASGAAECDVNRLVHAEIMVCLNIRENRNISELAPFIGSVVQPVSVISKAFTPYEVEMLDGAALYLIGHADPCNACLHFLHAVGIKDIRFEQLALGTTGPGQHRTRVSRFTADGEYIH